MLELLKKRRSIRKYSADKIAPEQIDYLIRAALLAPSSRGLCPWEFIVVDDLILIKKLSASKSHGSSFLSSASLAIVVLADPAISDVWIEDASIAALILHLTAASINLGSCWIQLRERKHDNIQSSEDYVRKLLNIEDKYRIEAIIAIGNPQEEKPPYQEKDLKYHKVFQNTYGHYRYKY